MQEEQIAGANSGGGRQPALSVFPHPFVPDGRSLYRSNFLPGETVGRYIERCGVALPRCVFRVFHNATVVPNALWDRLIPRPGDSVIIRAVSQGGGGGGKVLRTVAMVALIVVTYGVGSWAGLGASLASATGMSVGLASTAIMIGGSILISPLMPEIEA